MKHLRFSKRDISGLVKAVMRGFETSMAEGPRTKDDPPMPQQTDNPHTCSTCPHWDRGTSGVAAPIEEQTDGECRRHAPTVLHSPDHGVVAAWPTTDEHAWCGEHPHRLYAIGDDA